MEAQLILQRIHHSVSEDILGFTVISMEDKHCRVRQELENAKSVFEKHFPVTTLKSGILLQQFSFTLPAMITASSVKHMSA